MLSYPLSLPPVAVGDSNINYYQLAILANLCKIVLYIYNNRCIIHSCAAIKRQNRKGCKMKTKENIALFFMNETAPKNATAAERKEILAKFMAFNIETLRKVLAIRKGTK